jgi:hypothetical protein
MIYAAAILRHLKTKGRIDRETKGKAAREAQMPGQDELIRRQDASPRQVPVFRGGADARQH